MLYRAYEGLEDCHHPSPMATRSPHILSAPKNPGDNPLFLTGPRVEKATHTLKQCLGQSLDTWKVV